jgi:hypothetical protein
VLILRRCNKKRKKDDLIHFLCPLGRSSRLTRLPLPEMLGSATSPYAAASKGRSISRAMRSTVPWPTPRLMPQVKLELSLWTVFAQSLSSGSAWGPQLVCGY